MAVHRLNHAVLYVRDVDASKEFYGDVLGFRVVSEFPGAAFLQAPDSTNDHDLGLFQIGATAGPSEAGRTTVGLYHLAWEVDTLGELQRLAGALRERGALVGASDHGTTKSLYAKIPTASSSRSSGSSRPTCSPLTTSPPARRSARSISPPRSSGSVAPNAAASAFRSLDPLLPPTPESDVTT
jgi:catechol 2,3-dioxygenase-like lactoylglutathione lyase family enzyme